MKLDHDITPVFFLGNYYFVRIVNQGLCDNFN